MTKLFPPVELIRTFADGIIIQHPNQEKPGMFSIEKSGIFYLCEESEPTSIESFVKALNKWFNAWIWPVGDSIDKESIRIYHPDCRRIPRNRYIEFHASGEIFFCWINYFKLSISVSRAADILKEWHQEKPTESEQSKQIIGVEQ